MSIPTGHHAARVPVAAAHQDHAILSGEGEALVAEHLAAEQTRRDVGPQLAPAVTEVLGLKDVPIEAEDGDPSQDVRPDDPEETSDIGRVEGLPCRSPIH